MKISMEHIHNMYRQNEAQSVKKDENEYGINRKRNFDEIKNQRPDRNDSGRNGVC